MPPLPPVPPHPLEVIMVGAGYVGLVSGAAMARLGATVTVVESNPGRLTALRSGTIPLHEPGLGELVASERAANRLHFAANLAETALSAPAGTFKAPRLVFLAVGTPENTKPGQQGAADLSAVQAALDELASLLPPNPSLTILATKSTVPVGTGAALARRFQALRPDAPLVVTSNPEFLAEGQAVHNFLNPDRILVGLPGGDTPPSYVQAARQAYSQLYAPLVIKGVPLLFTKRESAELAKYAANAFLAVKIAFMGEIADFCEHSGASVDEVAHAMGLDPRIGPEFLEAGPGYGGSCLPKDVPALVASAAQSNITLTVPQAAHLANKARKAGLGGRMARVMHLAGKRIALLGLAFKAGTDDVRASPALDLATDLLSQGASLALHDPEALANARAAMQALDLPPQQSERLHWAPTLEAALTGADAAVLLAAWPCYKDIAPDHMAQLMKGRHLFDFRRAWQPQPLRAAGFTLHAVGMAEETIPSHCDSEL
ncbi:UDP-glucose dehydrogenase family protein [Formicincola oecophyllae]|nr:UDP-glucose/GDP-mannose dehydrogenase family protein [Formicincola oecophyllae]